MYIYIYIDNAYSDSPSPLVVGDWLDSDKHDLSVSACEAGAAKKRQQLNAIVGTSWVKCGHFGFSGHVLWL